MAIRDGASEDDIRNLPKYTFRQGSPFMRLDNDKKQEILRTQLESPNRNQVNELVLNPEDSVSTILIIFCFFYLFPLIHLSKFIL